VSSPVRRDSTDHAIVALIVAAGLTATLWVGASASALLSGHRPPRLALVDGLRAFSHLRNPAAAWRTPVGPALLYWCLTAGCLGLAALAVYLGRRVSRRPGCSTAESPESVEGLATRQQVRRTAGPHALTGKAASLRPSLTNVKPGDVGYRLGGARGTGCWASVEDSIIVLGPPRSGKGHNLVIPMILDSPGAVVTTSTRPDNLAVSFDARSRVGPVAVFDPESLAAGAGVLPTTRWSIVRGCERAQTAMRRAAALVADTHRSGVENGAFWTQQTLSVVRCLLHAAALDGRGPADLHRWSHGAARAKEAVAVLARNPDATPGWESALDAAISADPRTRDSVWAMVANTFAALADPAVLEVVSPPEGKEFDPRRFLAERSTLYLLGTASGASATANLVAAFVEDVVDTARHLAAASAGARLDPPLGLILDEAANYALPSLPSLVSEGGGSGITTVTVLQSLSQARDRWGREAAGAIWDSAIVKVALGGSASADDLADISRLIGDREVEEWSETVGGAGTGRSMSMSRRTRPILDPAAIRQIPTGFGLLLLRSAPPIMLRLTPWTARPDAKDLATARRELEASMAAAAKTNH